MSDFAYSLKYNTHFIIKNITGMPNSMLHLEGDNPAIPPPFRTPPFRLSQAKTISVFNYPINNGGTRDLLQIPGVTEEDIRVSLLKGVLRHKFLCGDIELVSSNVDLLQFSGEQRDFLTKFGFDQGVQISVDELAQDTIDFIISEAGGTLYVWKEQVPIIGLRNNSNRIFFTPDKFINGDYVGNVFYLSVEHNGKKLYENIDYTIGESSGPGSGYDIINLISFSPVPHSLLFATYAVKV